MLKEESNEAAVTAVAVVLVASGKENEEKLGASESNNSTILFVLITSSFYTFVRVITHILYMHTLMYVAPVTMLRSCFLCPFPHAFLISNTDR